LQVVKKLLITWADSKQNMLRVRDLILNMRRNGNADKAILPQV